MGSSQRLSGDNVGAVEASTKAVLTAVFDNLKANAIVKVDGPTRLFFPNGIELISVILKVNAKDGIDVEVKVAGEKGVKGASGVGGFSLAESHDTVPAEVE